MATTTITTTCPADSAAAAFAALLFQQSSNTCARSTDPSLHLSFLGALVRTLGGNDGGDDGAPALLPYVWPVSYQSAPQWTAAFALMMAWWLWTFIVPRTPAVARRAAAARLAKTRALQAAAVAWHAAEVANGRPGLPEATRLVSMLYDEVREARTAADGALPHGAAVEGLLRRAAAKELRKAMHLTREARFGKEDAAGVEDDAATAAAATAAAAEAAEEAASEQGPEANRAKALAEHASGEKLHDAVTRADTWLRQLAAPTDGGGAFVDAALLAQAKALLRRVYRAQSSNRRELYRLIAPALPYMLIGGLAAVANCTLRGVFHSIGGWAHCLELAVAGRRAESLHAIFALWFGHMAIECIQRIDSSYVQRAQKLFTSRIKDGVLSAMLTQDYEYFDRNEPGVLQERLNRDSTELGENLVVFPQRLLHRLAWMGVNFIIIVQTAPTALLLPAIAPLFVTVPLQYVCFKANSKLCTRQSKGEERAVAATSEVLREIKTVRQFAMEPAEACRYAESERNLAYSAEAMMSQRQLTDWVFWSVFCTGLFATMYAGLDYVESKEMTVSALLDIIFRINCHISFPLRELIDDLPRFAKLLRPLGRVCDLLKTNPRIEPGALPAFAVARDKAELAAVLACCDAVAPPTVGGGAAEFATLRKPLPAATATSDVAPTLGAHVTALVAADSHFVRAHDRATLDAAVAGGAAAALAFPVRVVFSKGLRPARFRGKIEFRDVTWAPPTDSRRMVLTGASFVVHPGEKVALVGPTGCGKSSCMGLLQRLYEPTAGQILLDDVPICDYDVHFLRSRVVIVDQSTVLFNGTIRDNVAYGLAHEPSDEEVVQACKDAKAWDFISDKPDGLFTMIMDGGKNLSGGQRQRLAIARAMIRKPDVILLDEATSALDNENEAMVQEALDEFARRGSALVIAHRLSTIKDSDRICVIDGGRVVESGSHDELLAKAKAEAAVQAKAAEAAAGGAAVGGVGEGAGALGALGPPPPSPRALLKQASEGSCGSSGGSPRDGASLGLGIPPMRRAKTEVSLPVAASKKAPASYVRLWNAATGEHGKKSIEQIRSKLQELQQEMAELRRREAHMLRIKSSLLAPGSGASPARAEVRPTVLTRQVSGVM